MHERMARLNVIIAVAVVALTACGSADSDASPADPASTTAPDPTDAGPPSTAPRTQRPVDELQYDPVLLRSELDAARQNWADRGWSSYRYRYMPVCFCEQEQLEAHVIDTKLVNDTGDSRLHGIEGWFDVIDDAIGTAYEVQVVYDDWGYPESVYIDVDEMIADEEFGLEFDGFFHVPDAVDKFMTTDHACGYGFSAASPDQSVAFQVYFDPSGDPYSGTYDLADATVAAVNFGADLMANWCDDVLEPDEPEPRVDERWTITGGTVTITIEGQRATGEFRDIMALTPDDVEYPLGNATIVNEGWGVIAG